MYVIQGPNVNVIFPHALGVLLQEGIERDSRYGRVLQYPTPVTTVYHQPCQRVLFDSVRDANPFFHLYEALWMLQGRRDVEGVKRFAARMATFSDDEKVYHGAYGHRWRHHFETDQLDVITEILKRNPDDRRCVLQMWDARADLGGTGKDLPCNTMATFQVATDGRLDLSVFCRSNDIVWGAYGANVVHMSMLLEYMAARIGVPVGRYYQTSINWHGYLNTIEPVRYVPFKIPADPYTPAGGGIRYLPLYVDGMKPQDIDEGIRMVVDAADGVDFRYPTGWPQFYQVAYTLMRMHAIYKSDGAKTAIDSMHRIGDLPTLELVDWFRAGYDWLLRRVK